MKEFTQEQIEKRFDELPSIIKEAIDTSDWGARIRRVASVNELRVDQGNALEKITQLTMLGLMDSSNFLNEVKGTLNLSDQKARKITIETGEEVFERIKTEIVKITRKESGLPEERNEIDEIIYGREEDKLNIYNIEESLDTEEISEPAPDPTPIPQAPSNETPSVAPQAPSEEPEAAPAKEVPLEETNNVQLNRMSAEAEIPQENTQVENISREQVAEEMKRDIEIIPDDIEVNEVNPEEDNISTKLETPTKATAENGALDPYREPIE